MTVPGVPHAARASLQLRKTGFGGSEGQPRLGQIAAGEGGAGGRGGARPEDEEEEDGTQERSLASHATGRYGVASKHRKNPSEIRDPGLGKMSGEAILQ